MSPYATPEWAGFLAMMRADPEDVNAPLAAADWLRDRGKGDHADFVEGCVRLKTVRDEYARRTHDDDGYLLWDETQSLYNRLRPLIARHCHEWTGGAVRKWHNPTAHDWPLGFLRAWQVAPLAAGSDREGNPRAIRLLGCVLARQPVRGVAVALPAMTFAPPAHYVDWLSGRFPGVSFHLASSTHWLRSGVDSVHT